MKANKAVNHARNYVYISVKARAKMKLWARKAGSKGYEMTCWATSYEDDGLIVVDDAYIVKHKGTAGDVEADDVDTALLISKLMAQGYEAEQMNCWVHSHPGRGVDATYLSSTDEANIERWLTGDYLVSIVWDSGGENPYCRVDFKKPRLSVVCDLEVDLRLSDEELMQAIKDFDEKSEKKTAYVFKGKGKGKGGLAGKHNNFLGRPIVERESPPQFTRSGGFDLQQGFSFDIADDEAFARWFENGDLEEADEAQGEKAGEEEEGETKVRVLTWETLTFTQAAAITSLCTDMMEKKISSQKAVLEVMQECKCSSEEASSLLSEALSLEVDVVLDEQGDDEDETEDAISQKILDEITERVWSGKTSFADGAIEAQQALEISFPDACKSLQHEVDLSTEDMEKELKLAGLRRDGSRLASKKVIELPAATEPPLETTFKVNGKNKKKEKDAI